MSDTNNKTFVAVYGTLRSGQGNYGVMVRAGGESLGLGWTENDANIYDYAHHCFPAVSLSRTSANAKVRVEVFEVPATYYKPAASAEDKAVAYSGHTAATVEEYEAGKAFLYVGTDGLEGYADHRGTSNSFYNRSLINIKLDSGDTVEALIYHIEGDEDEYDDVTLITSGDWAEFKADGWVNA